MGLREFRDEVRTTVGRGTSLDDSLDFKIRNGIRFLEKNFDFPYMMNSRDIRVEQSDVRSFEIGEVENFKSIEQVYFSGPAEGGGADDDPSFVSVKRINESQIEGWQVVAAGAALSYWLNTTNSRATIITFNQNLPENSIIRILLTEYSAVNMPSLSGSDDIEHPILKIAPELLLARVMLLIGAQLGDPAMTQSYQDVFNTEMQAMQQQLQDDNSGLVVAGGNTFGKRSDVRYGHTVIFEGDNRFPQQLVPN